MEILDGTTWKRWAVGPAAELSLRQINKRRLSMHISNQKVPHMRTPALMTLMFLLVASLLPAQNAENPEVAQLLLDCRDHATQLSRDADELESLPARMQAGKVMQ